MIPHKFMIENQRQFECIFQAWLLARTMLFLKKVLARMDTVTVNYDSFGSFLINRGHDMIAWRAKKFLTKEPTTIEWLQSLESDSILVDIGANIGIYSIPSALFHVKKVYAVEPEHKNFNELVKNIELNNLDDRKIEAIPIAISTEFASSITQLYLTADKPGMSCHQVRRNQT